ITAALLPRNPLGTNSVALIVFAICASICHSCGLTTDGRVTSGSGARRARSVLDMTVEPLELVQFEQHEPCRVRVHDAPLNLTPAWPLLPVEHELCPRFQVPARLRVGHARGLCFHGHAASGPSSGTRLAFGTEVSDQFAS